MRHPHRLLRDYLNNEADPAGVAAVRSHLARCPACREAVARERRLRSRLRAAAPMAGTAPASEEIPPRGPGRTWKLLALAGAALAAGGLALLTVAYLVGTWSQAPDAAHASADAAGWTQITGSGSTASSSDAAGDGSVELSEEQMAQLRDRGWMCPELQSAGMELVSARAVSVAGGPAVELSLAGRDAALTVYEQRSESAVSGAFPLDAVSGNSVVEEGYVLQDDGPGRPSVWLHPESPERAVVTARKVTYTVAVGPGGDPQALRTAVEEISLNESSRLVLRGPDSGEGVWDRIMRGFAVISGSAGNR